MGTDRSTKALQVILLTTAMFSVMGGPVLAPTLPAIKAAYQHVPHIEFWTKTLIAVTGLFSAIGAAGFGRVSDRWGCRRTWVLTLVCWGVFGSSGMIPQPFWTLLAGRACLGLSLGALLAANSALIADCFGRERQQHMMGMQSAFSSVGIVLALIVGGWLADLHWRLTFGVFLSAFAILPLVFICPELAKCEVRHPQPRSRLPLSSAPTWLYLFGFTATLAFAIIPTQLPFFIQSQGNWAASEIGLLLAVLPIASALTGRVYARIPQGGSRHLFLAAGAAMLAGFLSLSLAGGTTTLILGLVLVGAGFGLAMPHVNIVLVQTVQRERIGGAMGMLTGCKFMGQFLSPVLLQPVLAHSGYPSLLRFSGWFMLGVAVVVWAMGQRVKSPMAQEEVS